MQEKEAIMNRFQQVLKKQKDKKEHKKESILQSMITQTTQTEEFLQISKSEENLEQKQSGNSKLY